MRAGQPFNLHPHSSATSEGELTLANSAAFSHERTNFVQRSRRSVALL